MRAKSSNVILLTALFLACGVSQLSASGRNSDDDQALAGTNPRETPPATTDEHKPAWVIQAEKTLDREKRYERLLKEKYGDIRPRDSKH